MLMSKIITDAPKYQYRDTPFSARTVTSIVSEGIDIAKFDPLPLLKAANNGHYLVGGDGHSRLEAARRLAKKAALPAAWKRGGDWDVPHRFVDGEQAQRLSWTANMIHHTFNPCEEAKVFQAMLDAGRAVDEVAVLCHRSAAYVSKQLTLNVLCRDIRAKVGVDADAAGIDVLTATVLANGFQRHGIDVQRQQQLWHRCLKHAMLNFQSARKFINAVGPRLKATGKAGLLFALPANAIQVLKEAKDKASSYRSARIGLSLLVKARESGGLDVLPDLARWVKAHGQAGVDKLQKKVTGDADVLAALAMAQE